MRKSAFNFEGKTVATCMRCMVNSGMGFHAVAREIMFLYPGVTANNARYAAEEIFYAAYMQEKYGLSIDRIIEITSKFLHYADSDTLESNKLYTRIGGIHLSTHEVIHGLMDMAHGYSKIGW